MTPDPAIYQLDDALKAFGSETVVKEALRSFIGHAQLMTQQLRDAWKSRDDKQLRQTLHWLKGGLSYLHARRLRATCLELDSMVNQEPMPDLTEAIDRLASDLDELLDCASLYVSN